MVMMESTESSIVVVVVHGVAIRSILPEVATDDNTLGPEIWIFDLLDVGLPNAEFEALETIVLAWNLFKIDDLDALLFNSRLHIFNGVVDVSIANIEGPCKVGAPP